MTKPNKHSIALFSAIDRLAREGRLATVTTALISEYARVSEGVMFRHFPSKGAIFDAWIDSRAGRLAVALSGMAAGRTGLLRFIADQVEGGGNLGLLCCPPLDCGPQRERLEALMIGMLPTARRSDFTLDAMAPLQRYRALNEQVFFQRQDRPVELDIAGHDHLRLRHHDVMLEVVTTSFQIHLRADADRIVRFYNAAKLLSGPMAALTANSPFLFGHDLWAESRIPVFEQAVDIGGSDLTKRVSFGIKYAKGSILEIFEANLNRYPVLLPERLNQPPESLAHLRLHTGTIWRWNRPLVGFDPDGSPHLRIEHRVAPSGPTPADAVANAAFFFGASRALLEMEPPPETLIPFETARDNFYRCAREELEARVCWLGGREIPVRSLLQEELLPLARTGLERFEIDPIEIDDWLGIVQERLATGQNGTQWQRQHLTRNGGDAHEMTLSYLHHQRSGRPVHLWPA